MSSYLARLTALLLCGTRRQPNRRGPAKLLPALMFLVGLAFIGPLSAQFLPDLDRTYSADGDGRNLLDTADDLDPLPPQAEAEAVALSGRPGLTAVYCETFAQGPNPPPATPPPIGA